MTTTPLPSHLQVEITSACNLRCTMCLVSYRPPVNKLAGAMPLELFRRLVGENPALRRITLQGLAGLVAAKRAAGSATPWIRVVFVAMRDNVAELADLVRLLARIGVDELRVQNLSHSFSDTDPAGQYAGIRAFAAEQALWAGSARVREAFAAAGAAAAGTGIRLRLPSVSPATGTRRGCDWPWEAVYVTSAGAVQPCCMVMGDDRATLGHLGEQSFLEIWDGPAYRDFRRRLMSDDPPAVCRGCSLYRGTF